MPATQRLAETVPDFELFDLGGVSGGPARAVSGRSGAVVVFWSGICSHCQRYDGWLKAFPAQHADLALLVVASRQNESVESLRSVATQRGLDFPIFVDTDRSVARAYCVEQTPRIFLIDTHLRLIYRGAIDNFKYPRDPAHEAYLEEAIADFRAGRALGRPETPSFGCPIESVYYKDSVLK